MKKKKKKMLKKANSSRKKEISPKEMKKLTGGSIRRGAPEVLDVDPKLERR